MFVTMNNIVLIGRRTHIVCRTSGVLNRHIVLLWWTPGVWHGLFQNVFTQWRIRKHKKYVCNFGESCLCSL